MHQWQLCWEGWAVVWPLLGASPEVQSLLHTEQSFSCNFQLHCPCSSGNRRYSSFTADVGWRPMQWERIGWNLRPCLVSGQCPVHSVRVGLFTTAWHPPVHEHFLLLRNASSLGEILLRKVAWMEYYKKDVYSNLKYAQIIHRGSNHPFSLPPRKKCKSHLLNKAGSEDDKILTFLKCYWRRNVTSMHNCITLLSVIFYQSKKCYTWIWGQTCLIRF